jgi:hypothetical protein
MVYWYTVEKADKSEGGFLIVKHEHIDHVNTLKEAGAYLNKLRKV